MFDSTPLNISLTDWVCAYHPATLRWSDARGPWTPAAHAELNAEEAAGYLFLELDEVEFYFEGEAFDRLSKICIKAWARPPATPSVYVDYGWLRHGLTNAQVQAIPQALSTYQTNHCIFVKDMYIF